MSEEKYNFLLMGKTGHGKSATGNTLMNRRCFKTSSNGKSETKDVECSFAQFKGNILLVVDGPGLEDTQLNTVRDKEVAVKNMSKALAMCYGSVNAFLFTIKFGIRFTAEEQTALNSLKRIFGEDYMKFLIVVVTCGDQFEQAMEEEGRVITFEEWCKKQTGELGQLYADCGGRFVLFDNRTKDDRKRESQTQQLVELARGLKHRHGIYTSHCFQNAENERKKLIVELKAPELTLEIQQKVSLLNADIDAYSKQPTDARKQLQKRIQDLKNEIEVQDQGYKVLSHMRENVTQIEANLHNTEELQRLALDLEKTRKSKERWAAIGTCLVIAGVLVGTGVGAAAVAAASTGPAALGATGAVAAGTGPSVLGAFGATAGAGTVPSVLGAFGATAGAGTLPSVLGAFGATAGAGTLPSVLGAIGATAGAGTVPSVLGAIGATAGAGTVPSVLGAIGATAGAGTGSVAISAIRRHMS